MEVLADKNNRRNVRVKFTEKGLNKSGELVRNIFTKKFPFDSEEVKSKTKMLGLAQLAEFDKRLVQLKEEISQLLAA